ncbi:MAG: DUF5331 domain-containing protein [Microcystaceae cyanobacterium]
MSNFEAIKADLKEKWLDYYAANQTWISKLMNANSKWNKCSDGYRPIAWLILGAITYTEEPLADFMLPFCELQSDPDQLIQVLGLDFDPDEELERRVKKHEENQQNSLTQTAEVIGLLSEDLEYLEAHRGLEEIRAHIRQQENSS